MKAIAIDDFGAPPTLHDLPVPEPGEGQVLVRVQASSVNGFDLAVANGYLKGAMEHRFPVVLGKDFAGLVEAVGPGIESLRVGDSFELVNLLVPGGRLASTLGLTAEQLPDTDAQITSVMAMPTTATLERLAALVVSGDLTVPVQTTYDLADVPQAFAEFAAGTRGKIALAIG
jgi:NADPH:quinone reductase-like Zn-dependent oxidoreductase